MRNLYGRFMHSEVTMLPMKGKRKPIGHKEKPGRQSFRRQPKKGRKKCPDFVNEFKNL